MGGDSELVKAQQDAEYEESLRNDQLKALHEKEENEFNMLVEVIGLSKAEQLRVEKESKANQLPDEPPADTDASIRITVLLRSVGRTTRRFNLDDEAEKVFDWIESHPSEPNKVALSFGPPGSVVLKQRADVQRSNAKIQECIDWLNARNLLYVRDVNDSPGH